MPRWTPRESSCNVADEFAVPTQTSNVALKSSSSLSAAASKLGKIGGKIGGPARARKLSRARRKQIALMGARARIAKLSGDSA